MIRYFKKIYPQNPVTLSNGTGFTFPATASGIGLLAVDTAKRPDLIRDFDVLIAKQVGGISEITQAEYEDEKKKTPSPQQPAGPEVFSRRQVNQMRLAAEDAARADKEKVKRQLTPVISRSFKRPGMKFAGATANPEPGGTQPGQWRPGTSDR